MVDFGETELPVDFRTVERVAVPGEDDALYGSDPFVPQRCRQLRPVAAAGYGVAQRVENFIFRFVRFAQAVLLDILFARCEVEPMPDGQLLAESLRTVANGSGRRRYGRRCPPG